jgi:hypothetical protein
MPEYRDSVNLGSAKPIAPSGTASMEENMRDWFRLFVVGGATPVLLKISRNEGFPNAIGKGKSAIRSFLKIASPLLAVSCTSVMVQTPQQMSDFAIKR